MYWKGQVGRSVCMPDFSRCRTESLGGGGEERMLQTPLPRVMHRSKRSNSFHFQTALNMECESSLASHRTAGLQLNPKLLAALFSLEPAWGSLFAPPPPFY